MHAGLCRGAACMRSFIGTLHACGAFSMSSACMRGLIDVLHACMHALNRILYDACMHCTGRAI